MEKTKQNMLKHWIIQQEFFKIWGKIKMLKINSNNPQKLKKKYLEIKISNI